MIDIIELKEESKNNNLLFYNKNAKIYCKDIKNLETVIVKDYDSQDYDKALFILNNLNSCLRLINKNSQEHIDVIDKCKNYVDDLIYIINELKEKFQK